MKNNVEQAMQSKVYLFEYKNNGLTQGVPLVVRDASNVGNCAGSASDLRRIKRRICVGSASDQASDPRRIWWEILTLALAKTTSSIPRQSDAVALKPNLCRATKLRVRFSPKATKSRLTTNSFYAEQRSCEFDSHQER